MAMVPPPILCIPAEIHCEIMKLLDYQSLSDYIDTCRSIHSVFIDSASTILEAVVTNELGSLLCIAIARLEATRVSWKPEGDFEYNTEYQSNLDNFLNIYMQAVPVGYFTFVTSYELVTFHHSIIQLANVYGEFALDEDTIEDNGVITNYPLTEHEVHRVLKTLYIHDLVVALLPPRFPQIDTPTGNISDDKGFWMSLASYISASEYREWDMMAHRLCRRIRMGDIRDSKSERSPQQITHSILTHAVLATRAPDIFEGGSRINTHLLDQVAFRVSIKLWLEVINTQGRPEQLIEAVLAYIQTDQVVWPYWEFNLVDCETPRRARNSPGLRERLRIMDDDPEADDGPSCAWNAIAIMTYCKKRYPTVRFRGIFWDQYQQHRYHTLWDRCRWWYLPSPSDIADAVEYLEMLEAGQMDEESLRLWDGL